MARRSKSGLISQRAYARRRGVTHTSVQEAIKLGRISTVGGMIDPVKADKQWKENTDRSKPRNSVTGDPTHRRDPRKPERPMGEDTEKTEKEAPDEASGYAFHRARREKYQADLAMLSLGQRSGQLLKADEVKAAAFSEAQRERDILIALPDRLSATLAAIQDPEEVHRILEAEIERICQEISKSAERA